MVADKSSFHHRPSLKQANKPFKSRYASKGHLRDLSKGRLMLIRPETIILTNLVSIIGRVQRQTIKGATMRKQSRIDRRNAARIDQKKKRETIVSMARLFTGRNGVPKIVVRLETNNR
jgi:pre-rRNA-processing protein TSR1